MRFARGGYTIIEVLIVLAVSGAILIAAATVFSGRQGRTQFNQAMQDVNSQIHSFVDDIRVSVFPEAGEYKCGLDSSGRPKLTPKAPGDEQGTSADCIFLGKALYIDTTTTPNKIKAYTVLGARLIGTDPVTTFKQASPEPVLGSTAETYTIGANSTVKSSEITDSGGTVRSSNLVGFYNSLQSPVSGSQSLAAYAYVDFSGSSGTSANLTSALKQTTPTGLYPITSISKWQVCFESGSSNQTVLFTVIPTATGVSTNLEYKSC